MCANNFEKTLKQCNFSLDILLSIPDFRKFGEELCTEQLVGEKISFRVLTGERP